MNNEIEKIIRDNMTEGMLQIDKSGSILYANEVAVNIIGQDVIDRKIGRLLLKSEYNDNFVQIIIDSFLYPHHINKETVTLKVDDELRYLKVMAYADFMNADKDKDELQVIVCFQDITDYMKANQLNDEIKNINKLNHSLSIRNKLIRKIFGSFVIRKEDGEDLITGLKAKELNEGVFRDITIIQSDLRGYTALSYSLKTDDLISVMNYYISEMSDIIMKHHGMIVEILGDGIVSAFGGLGHYDTQFEDAVATAIEMQQKIVDVNKWIAEHNLDAHLKMGIGIDCGKAIMGFVGNGDLRTFDVMGQVIRSADKIQSNTIEGDILISEKIKNNIKPDLEIGKVLSVHIMNPEKEEKVYQVKGIGKPYSLKCPEIVSERQKLNRPYNSAFYLIDGKVRENEQIACEIIEISDSDMCMKCDKKIYLLSNIVMDIGDSLYGKIIENNDDIYVVNFTSTPKEFANWKKDILSVK